MTNILDKKKVLLHEDNARVKTIVVAMTNFVKFDSELLSYPPYSVDLAPQLLFLKLKKWLEENIFAPTMKSSG